MELLAVPRWFAPMLDGTGFAGRQVLAAILLGLVVGGPQWVGVALHLRRSRWWVTAHTLAGTVMLGWIAGECLVLGAFSWPHALWGGVGALQLLLVCAFLGAFPARSSGA
ncbi:hypothetical protein [Arsenicicoccus sp. oral taxon 190]|uniref:hypothetical protein n=1 Tax=Arsenicicoccus sp. oral taxon 190 TaxID=1658671 RepID=UPI001C118D38|nr:hypothetical protein [Arsenicicoccus sp. oral taxon 190]